MRVALASGLGVEGKSLVRYYQAKGDQVIIYDTRPASEVIIPAGIECVTGPDAFSKIKDVDLIVRSPSRRPDSLPDVAPIWSSCNEFFAKCPAPIIGVTGTKGKGTTSTLIAELLAAAGKTVHLVGNIGTPALDQLSSIKPTDFVVFELSSFQLWDLQKSPQLAVLLMIEPDHMDVHASMEEYVAAKSQITIHQTEGDLLVHHPTNELVQQIVAKSPARKTPYMRAPGAEIVDGQVAIDGHTICGTDEVGLLGEHNLENICAAVTAVWQYSQDVATIAKVLKEFTGLPYRLELVRQVRGVRYYNDSFASAPGAAVAATKAIPDPKIVIYGGFDKGLDLSVIAQAAQSSHIKKALLIGKTGPKIAEAMDALGFKDYEIMDGDMTAVVARAQVLAVDGDSVLLSPGCASFDMFKNFEERGKAFNQAVGQLT